MSQDGVEPTDTAIPGTRLNKWLAETGVCSRREADAWIAAGRIGVNGAVASLGTRVSAGDEVTVDGLPAQAARRKIYLALHKPIGVECTTDRRVAGNIVDFVGHSERVFPVGRLDRDSEGLILLTNDGDIVNALLRAEHGHEKEYLVEVDRPVTPAFLAALSQGVPILDTVTLPCRTWVVGKNTFGIILTQGLNRQIRRMCEYFDYTVRRLRRVRVVNVELGALPAGRWRDLTAAELAGLLPDRFAAPAASVTQAARSVISPRKTPSSRPRG
jgi:23S rRNA pseudouridine2604 synthase